MGDGSPFDEGFQLGARVEHGVAVEAVVNALLNILGKDPGDGIIDLGAAGRWVFHSQVYGHMDSRWHRQEDVRLNYREQVAGATK
jgi:hypothetical protein